jgi:hypothetical protein
LASFSSSGDVECVFFVQPEMSDADLVSRFIKLFRSIVAPKVAAAAATRGAAHQPRRQRFHVMTCRRVTGSSIQNAAGLTGCAGLTGGAGLTG